jgi:hypothetical protein
MSLFIQRRSVPFWMPHERVWVAAREDFVVAKQSGKTAASSPIQRFNDSTIQRFNDSTIQRFNDSTIQRFNEFHVLWRS